MVRTYWYSVGEQQMQEKEYYNQMMWKNEKLLKKQDTITKDCFGNDPSYTEMCNATLVVQEQLKAGINAK